MKRILLLACSTMMLLVVTSCSDDDAKRAEFTQVAQSRTTKELLDDLYIGSDGDVQAIARILHCTPSSIDRIRSDKTIATTEFEERVVDVMVYYNLNDQSFSKLRAQLDDEWGWYDSVLHWPSHHPWSFWIVNIVLLLILAFATAIAIWPILAEILLFLVAWIAFLICAPGEMEDRYVDTFNPTIEQVDF